MHFAVVKFPPLSSSLNSHPLLEKEDLWYICYYCLNVMRRVLGGASKISELKRVLTSVITTMVLQGNLYGANVAVINLSLAFKGF